MESLLGSIGGLIGIHSSIAVSVAAGVFLGLLAFAVVALALAIGFIWLSAH